MRELNEYFSFRQRFGRPNWKLIGNVDIEDIVNNSKIDELQSLLDALAFCQFNSKEINYQDGEIISKTCQLMQYIIEYLLHCQELHSDKLNENIKLNAELVLKHDKLKQAFYNNNDQLHAAKEQLDEFMKSARNCGLPGNNAIMDDNRNKMRIVIEPTWNDRDFMQPKADANNATDNNMLASQMDMITDTMSRHEMKSLQQLQYILQQQRDFFVQEITPYSRSLQSETAALKSQTEMSMKRLEDVFNNYKDLLKVEFASANKRSQELTSLQYRAETQDNKAVDRLRAQVNQLEEERGAWMTDKRRLENEVSALQSMVENRPASDPLPSPSPKKKERKEILVNRSMGTDALPPIIQASTTAAAEEDSGTVAVSAGERRALQCIKYLLLSKYVKSANHNAVYKAWQLWKQYSLQHQLMKKIHLLESTITGIDPQVLESKESEFNKQLQAEKHRVVIANARYSNVLKLKCDAEAESTRLKQQLVLVAQANDNSISAQQLELIHSHQACVLDTIHPVIKEAKTEDDLYCKLHDRIQTDSRRVDVDSMKQTIAAEIARRLSGKTFP